MRNIKIFTKDYHSMNKMLTLIIATLTINSISSAEGTRQVTTPNIEEAISFLNDYSAICAKVLCTIESKEIPKKSDCRVIYTFRESAHNAADIVDPSVKPIINQTLQYLNTYVATLKKSLFEQNK